MPKHSLGTILTDTLDEKLLQQLEELPLALANDTARVEQSAIQAQAMQELLVRHDVEVLPLIQVEELPLTLSNDTIATAVSTRNLAEEKQEEPIQEELSIVEQLKELVLVIDNTPGDAVGINASSHDPLPGSNTWTPANGE